ncbi:unnamed protein product [Brassica napus]|uniref:(rape) hypothetical protein n=1 Tax=Brassica napus TaxID=3708 RepID=A0A816SW51_BRANA|nr:unnamed protein product [Brassica napus]
MSGGEEYLEDLAGYEYVSQLRVTPYNFIPNHRTLLILINTQVPSVSYKDIKEPTSKSWIWNLEKQQNLPTPWVGGDITGSW